MKATALIARIREAATDELAAPREFFNQNRIRYTQLAKSIARATMIGLQPVEITNEQWVEQIDNFLAGLSTEDLENPIGLRIGQEGRTAALKRKLGKRGDDPNMNVLTEADILEWTINEKKLTEEDQRLAAASDGNHYQVIANRIQRGLEQQHFGFADKDYSKIQKSIEDFVDKKSEVPGLTAYLPSIAKAWITIFSGRFPDDIKNYQTQKLKEIVKRRV